MLVNPRFVLKTLFKTITLTMPNVMYNPLANNRLYVPIDIKPHSTYINFKLNTEQVNNLNHYVSNFNESLTLVPITLYENDKANYYLSVNIYNSTSPIFMTENNIVRCELNTYVMDKSGTKGTLILDYMTDGPSMDPVSLFKKNEYLKKLVFNKNKQDIFNIFCKSYLSDIYLSLNFSANGVYPKKLSVDLLEYTDNIFYKNGILDKVYYDNTLINPVIMDVKLTDFKFIYKDMMLDDLHSIFYFKNNLNFVGSMWDNLNA